ncbi:MAG: 30S ribosomal protein S2 [Deltaproteobacteria bacterium]|nr:30S ribosomal protein S2 [Deltaproteobacteria bacterium]
MSDAQGDSPTAAPAPPAAAESAAAPAMSAAAPEAAAPRRKGGVRELIEVGAHFGHQTRRWNPSMKPFIFGERNGVHIIDLDQTAPRLAAGMEFLRETVAQGGKVLFVGTKRQAQAPVRQEAERCGQFYVNNRWLGGMLTNFRTVRKSIERFKEQLATAEDAEQFGELSKKERSWLGRSITKYRKSLDGLREMQRLPDALFLIDISKERIAVTEARRLGIPIVAIVDTNCSPDGIDFVIPANDDSIRAIQLYCALAADACEEGESLHQARLVSDSEESPSGESLTATGRRVVEIQRSPGGATRRGGRGPRRQAGRSYSAGGAARREAEPRPATPAPPAAEPAAGPAAETPAAPKLPEAQEAQPTEEEK